MGNNISKALLALHENVSNSALSDSEKNFLKVLIEKIIIYYSSEYKKIEERHQYFDYIYKLERLSAQMTDYIVAINDTINGKNDLYLVVNRIYKEMNYDDKKGVFKRKRLI